VGVESAAIRKRAKTDQEHQLRASGWFMADAFMSRLSFGVCCRNRSRVGMLVAVNSSCSKAEGGTGHGCRAVR